MSVVHKSAYRPYLALLHLLLQLFHHQLCRSRLIVYHDIGITRNLATIAAIHLIPRKHQPDVHLDDVLHIHDVIIAIRLRKLHKPGHLAMRKFHDVVFRHPIVLSSQAGTEIQAVGPEEHLYTSTAHRYRLQVRENLFAKIVSHKFMMPFFHLLLALVEHNPVPLQIRQNAVLENTDSVFQLSVHLIGYLPYQFMCLLWSLLLTISPTCHSLMFRHTYLIEFLQIGRVDGHEIDTVVQRDRSISCLHQHPMIERQPTDVTVEISIVAFHTCLRFAQI